MLPVCSRPGMQVLIHYEDEGSIYPSTQLQCIVLKSSAIILVPGSSKEFFPNRTRGGS